MLVIADAALTTTLVYIFVWGIAFPAFVTALIAYAIIQARGEHDENVADRRFRKR